MEHIFAPSLSPSLTTMHLELFIDASLNEFPLLNPNNGRHIFSLLLSGSSPLEPAVARCCQTENRKLEGGGLSNLTFVQLL